jgi:hypothetical protein
VAANDRLLTSSFVVSANAIQNIPILLTRAQDAGLTARLTASGGNAITAVVTTQIRNATLITISTPGAVYEGSNTSVQAVLARGQAVGTMTGTLSMSLNTSTAADGTSNTVFLGEMGPNAAITPVNTTGSTATIQKPLTNAAPGSVRVSAVYSGDVANDPASASAGFTVVSRTPQVLLTTSATSAQAGVPFSISATVQTNGKVASPQPFTGSLNLLQSSFPVGGAIALSTGDSLVETASITPLTLLPITLNATYSGDAFFRQAASLPVTVNVQKAPTTLTINSSPSTYTCDGNTSSFGLTLSFPAQLGLTNKIPVMQVRKKDGTIAQLNGTFTTFLKVAPIGPKDIQAKATSTIQGVLPLDISGVFATFGSDPLLSDAVSSTVNPTYQLGTVSVTLFQDLSSTNPKTLSAQVASACGVLPTGSVEFQDAGATLGVVSLPNASPFVQSGFTGVNSASLSVSRPAGVHNITVKYSGDSHFQPATTPPVAVTFQ